MKPIKYKGSAMAKKLNEINESRARLVSRHAGDKLNITRSGADSKFGRDLYLRLLECSWSRLLWGIVCVYLLLNFIFSFFYYILPFSIENARADSFVDAFFFSVQTFSTIGYGKMSPHGLLANLLVTGEVLTGFIFFAMVTGLIFAKFSRPTARVMFSNVAVICNYKDKPHLMIRIANERQNRIVDANVHAVVLKKEVESSGFEMRRLYDLNLLRSRIPIMQLTWTLMHAIDESSPLYGATEKTFQNWDAEIIVSLTGIDETLSQTIHARWSYIATDLKWNAMFEDIVHRSDDEKRMHVDYRKFHDVRPSQYNEG